MIIGKFLIPAAVLASALGLATAKNAIKPGVERWPIKTSATIEAAQPMDFDRLLNMPNVPNVKMNDPRYGSHLLSSGAVPEGAIVSIEGYLRLVALEGDGDYHVQLAKTPTANEVIIVEVPYPAFVKNAGLKLRATQVRDEIKNLMPSRAEPSPSGHVFLRPHLVRVEGQLFYDDAHVGTPPRGKHGMKATSLWELHPVTALTVLDQLSRE